MSGKGISRNKGQANPFYGKKHSLESRAKMSLSHKGKKRPPRDPKWNKRISEAKKGKFTGADNPFYGRHHTEETKLLLSQNHIADPKFKRFGSENGMWKGGVTDNHSKLRNRYHRKLKLWREAVYARDNYICQSCKMRGSRANPLNAHHIKSFIQYPRLRFEISNGVTLCLNCHKRLRQETILEVFLLNKEAIGG